MLFILSVQRQFMYVFNFTCTHIKRAINHSLFDLAFVKDIVHLKMKICC